MNTPAQSIIKPRDREAVIRALRSGVVPATGLQHIQVGRSREIASFLRDIDTVADGGSAFRVVAGEYGSGKTFFLSLARSLALEKGLLAMTADLSPEKRFHGSQGQPRRLLRELVASLSTRTKRDGNALPLLLEHVVGRAQAEGVEPAVLLEPLIHLPGGHDFRRIVLMAASGEGPESEDALKWLQAEFATRTDAFRAVGVRRFLGDGDLGATLRLYAALARLAGFKGLWVSIDELVNLYKITNAPARKANYEEILSLLNATLQGHAGGLGIVLGSTPETITDTRRGLYSYEALRSRLAENTLAGSAGLADYDSTVLRLPNLTREELFLLLQRVRRLMASGDPEIMQRVPDEALEAFMRHCFNRIGESYFRTPRNTLKAFIDLLALLRQYPDQTWQSLLPGVGIQADLQPSPLSSTGATSQSHTALGSPSQTQSALGSSLNPDTSNAASTPPDPSSDLTHFTL